ncbi:Metallo-dependent phosphatase [Mycena filopes]|nr:Metallo-dependent phosphatase [Mycena filopes]
MLLPILLLASGAAAFPLAHSFSSTLANQLRSRKLTFDARGNFKVASFSDMHFGEGEEVVWGPQQDLNTSIVHANVLDNERPDYVVFNGDLITGENVFAANATKYLDQLFAPTALRKIPFSSTHGNHDNSLVINHLEEIEYEQKHYSALSYTRADVGPKPYGCGNYWVPVYANQNDFVPALVMWFFDSRSFVTGGPGQAGGPTPPEADFYWVDEHTVPQWIKRQSELMGFMWKTVPPALVFVHIPVQKADVLAPLPSVGDHDDEPDPATQGFLNNTYTGLDLPFWNALVDLDRAGTVLAVTSGHDHGESWCARATASAGVPICFNGHSGYGGYVTPHSGVRNARVFGLALGDLRPTGKGGKGKGTPVVRTWNSYEDMTTGEEVVLGLEYMKEYN